MGVERRDVQQVLLAGSFGSYLSPASAVRIGLVPKIPVLRIVSAGNVAGEGAKMTPALQPRARRRADPAGGGELCRALRPPRLQRPVHRPPRLPGLTRRAGRVIACGAIADAHQPTSSARDGWPVDVIPCRRCCTTIPSTIAGRGRAPLRRARCGTTAGRGGLRRLRDLRRARRAVRAAGPAPAGRRALLRRVRRRERMQADVRGRARHLRPDRLPGPRLRPPGVAELGLDRHPELRDDYFGNYTRVVWLAQRPDAELRTLAQRAAERIGLPLEVVPVGDEGPRARSCGAARAADV